MSKPWLFVLRSGLEIRYHPLLQRKRELAANVRECTFWRFTMLFDLRLV